MPTPLPDARASGSWPRATTGEGSCRCIWPQRWSLSERYITDRFLPDKAIDLLDEACACCNLRHPELTRWQETQEKVAELEKQQMSLEQTPTDEPLDYEQLANLRTELARLRNELPALEAQVQNIAVSMEDVAQVIELWTGIPP